MLHELFITYSPEESSNAVDNVVEISSIDKSKLEAATTPK